VEARPDFAALLTSSEEKRQEEWRKVLDAEVKGWSALSYMHLISELHDPQASEVYLDSKKYQMEVELLENNEKYLHVAVAVDDGSLPASISPLTQSFIRQKTLPAS
jgi:hypothetical protein